MIGTNVLDLDNQSPGLLRHPILSSCTALFMQLFNHLLLSIFLKKIKTWINENVIQMIKLNTIGTIVEINFNCLPIRLMLFNCLVNCERRDTYKYVNINLYAVLKRIFEYCFQASL